MPEIEYLTLAHHAEAINGLLYLQGAGLTDLYQPRDAAGGQGMLHVGIAVSILMGWNEANQRFGLVLSIRHEDGSVLVSIDGQVESGRPPGLPPGSDLRSVLAVSAEVQFPQPGGYQLRAGLDDRVRSVSFRVHQNG